MRKFLYSLLLAFALPAAAGEKPNIVFILADDLGWGELGCYGQKKIPTPNIDKLAAEGMRFTQHYSGAPVCAPARCVLLTGRHLGHAEIRGNMQAKVKFPQFDEGQLPLTAEAVTVANVLQKAGYATGAVGKWGLGPVGSTGDPAKKGFDLFFGYNCQAIAHSFYPKSIWRNDQRIPLNEKPVPGHGKQPEGPVTTEIFEGKTHTTPLMVNEAREFITKHAAKPFFLYLAFTEPHVALHPLPEMLAKFPAEWDDRPYRGECGYFPHPRPRAAYAAMIATLDDAVGKIMAELDAKGLKEKTLVVFTSDNGATHDHNGDQQFHVGGADPKFFNSSAGLRGYKGSVYEGGIRVPMIARFPGKIAAGTTSDTPCYFADWFPTFCAATKLEAPAHLDGENLWPVLTEGKKLANRKPLVWVYPEYTGQVAVRMGDYKAVRQNLSRPRQIGGWELYDIAKDPNETKNLAAEKPEIIKQAGEILRRETSPNANFPLKLDGVF